MEKQRLGLKNGVIFINEFEEKMGNISHEMKIIAFKNWSQNNLINDKYFHIINDIFIKTASQIEFRSEDYLDFISVINMLPFLIQNSVFKNKRKRIFF